MTAYQVLLRELVKYSHTTYASLMRRYGPRGYNYAVFHAAVFKLRRLGIVAPPTTRGHIVKAAGAACPCCGRPL